MAENPLDQPQAATQSSAFPRLTERKGFTKEAKGGGMDHRLGAAWDGARKCCGEQLSSSTCSCAGGCEMGMASVPSGAGRMLGKILKD